jgi:hypothetical protein
MRGTEQTVKFDTVPTGANVAIAGQRLTTPAEISLKRKTTYSVVISKPQYRTIEFTLEPEWDGVSLVGNLIIPGGSAGFVVDTADGADKRFYELTEIDMLPSTRPTDSAVLLKDYKGHLLTDDQLAIAIEADRKDKSQFFRGQP